MTDSLAGKDSPGLPQTVEPSREGKIPQPRLPEHISKYHVKRVIDSGGMGTVFEATQDNPRRVVAVKVMKQGIASRSALRRFEYEGQILGRLRHPGIAQIYEAGMHTDHDGLLGPAGASVPFFAMEYIPNAKPITRFADEKTLSTRQRMELFAKVCDAIHHGHQKGIIHRDLKPSNILVTTDPSAPPLSKGGLGGVVKVIDFGVARSTDSDLAITTLQTDVGQLIGTLQYMSPEQCEADPHDIDIRSDVYSLGVVFYELLCGKLPYDVRGMPIHQATWTIRDQTPTKLSTLDKTLRGDVETIALKALEKERERRYQSTADFSHDIQRYLTGEAILAHRASIVYQVRVFARRNKGVFASLAAVFVVLFTGVIVSTSLFFKAQAERDRAIVAEQQESEARADEQTQRQLLERTLYFRNIMLAGEAIQRGDVKTGDAILRQCPEEQRNWEWYFLGRQTDDALLTLTNSARPVLDVGFSNDGAEIVAVYGTNSRGVEHNTVQIRRWSIQDGRPLGDFSIGPPPMRSAFLNPNGTHIAVALLDGSISIYGVESNEPMKTFPNMGDGIGFASLSPDASRLVSCSAGSLLVHDVASGASVCRFDLPWPYRVSGLHFSGDSKRLLVQGYVDNAEMISNPSKCGELFSSCSLALYDLERCNFVRDFTRTLSPAYSPADLSKDGTTVAYLAKKGFLTSDILVFDVEKNAVVTTLDAPDGVVSKIRFSPDSRHLLIVSMPFFSLSEKMEIIDLADPKNRRVYKGHKASVGEVEFHPERPLVVTASLDKTVKLWSLTQQGLPMHITSGNPRSISTSRDGRILAYGPAYRATDGVVTIVSLSNRAVTHRYDVGQKLNALALAPDGRHFFVGGTWEGDDLDDEEKAAIKVVDVQTGETTATLRGLSRNVAHIDVSPDGTRLLGCGGSSLADQMMVVQWEISTGRVISTFGNTYWSLDVAYSPEGTSCAEATNEGAALVFDAGDGRLRKTCRGDGTAVDSVAFVPKSDALVFGTASGNVYLCNITSLSGPKLLGTHEREVNSIACSPDGERCASGGGDSIKLWDPRTHQLVLTWHNPGGEVVHLEFTPDGAMLIVGNLDQTITFLDSHRTEARP